MLRQRAVLLLPKQSSGPTEEHCPLLYARSRRRKKSRMNTSADNEVNTPGVLYVASGEDRFGEQRSLGISTIAFKVTPQPGNDLLVLENTFHAPGGPARHMHYEQDEWFYAVEGEFMVEVGQERFRLTPGDSLLAPRRIPHVWACVGNARGRILIVFQPAGLMEAFFRTVTQANAMPPQDPELWRSHGMELLGPPLALDSEIG